MPHGTFNMNFIKPIKIFVTATVETDIPLRQNFGHELTHIGDAMKALSVMAIQLLPIFN